MRIGLKSLKSRSVVLAVMGLAIMVGAGVITYMLLGSSKGGTITPSSAQAFSTPPRMEPSSPPAASLPQPLQPTPEVAKQADKVFAEKNPFKAEFLDRYNKTTLPKERVAAPQLPDLQKILETPPLEIVKPSDQNLSPTPKPKPAIRIYGIYAINGKSIALTDKGEMRTDMEVEGHKIKGIDQDGLELDGVESKYYITKGTK